MQAHVGRKTLGILCKQFNYVRVELCLQGSPFHLIIDWDITLNLERPCTVVRATCYAVPLVAVMVSSNDGHPTNRWYLSIKRSLNFRISWYTRHVISPPHGIAVVIP